MDVARGEMVEAELTRLIEKRSSREMDSDKREELWQESLRAYNVRGREEKRLAWCEYHREQAERHWVVERHQDRCYHEPPLRGG